MKIIDEQNKFIPFSIIVETEEEARALYGAFMGDSVYELNKRIEKSMFLNNTTPISSDVKTMMFNKISDLVIKRKL